MGRIKKATAEQLIEITTINTGINPTERRGRTPEVIESVKYLARLAKVAGYSDSETGKILKRERTTILHHRRK